MPGCDLFASNPVGRSVNGSLWTIAFEAWTYAGIAMLGALGLLGRRALLIEAFVGSIALAALFEAFDINWGAGILGHLLGWPRLWSRLLPSIFAGLVLHALGGRVRWNTPMALLASAGLVVGAMVPPLGMIVAVPTCGAYLLFAVALASPLKGWTLPRGVDLSYGIYLYAFPIQQSIMALIGHPTHPLILFALATPPAIAAGAASWFLVERRFLGSRARTNPGESAALPTRPDLAASRPQHPAANPLSAPLLS